jgi:hypothetical protein
MTKELFDTPHPLRVSVIKKSVVSLDHALILAGDPLEV